MKWLFVWLVPVVCCMAACGKKKGIAPVSGSINGKPAITLYGSSTLPADFIFLGTDSSVKEMSYDGRILTYVYYSAAAPTAIFISYSGSGIALANLSVSATRTILTIDTAYTFNFASKIYTSN